MRPLRHLLLLAVVALPLGLSAPAAAGLCIPGGLLPLACPPTPHPEGKPPPPPPPPNPPPPPRPRGGAPVRSIGVADQVQTFFFDRRFTSLGVKPVRLVLTWDVLRNATERTGAEYWLRLAKQEKLDVLIVFARNDQRPLPGVATYRRAVRAFVHRHPEVRTYAAWNEANLCSSRLCHRPQLAARYYKAMRTACRRCRVIGAELVAAPPIKNLVEAGTYARRMRRAGHVSPRLWAFHPYTDANRFQTRWLRRAMRSTPGQVWLDEVGGMVHRPPYKGRKPHGYEYGAGVRRSAKVLHFIFHGLRRMSSRITRVYIYQWDSGAPRSWDSALVAAGKARPGYRELKAAVEAARRAHR